MVASSKKRTWSPSGRNCGTRCEYSVPLGILVSSLDVPPAAGTVNRPEYGAGEKTIVSSGAQEAPRPSAASQITCTVPPSEGTRFSLPPAKKPMFAPSGDQKG